MPHVRKRYAEDRIKKGLSFSSVVGVLGQRQVGKTTLLESLAASYSTFDLESDLLEAEQNPELFLSNRKHPFAIDESQMCPRIFPGIKEAVRRMKSPGQFLLSGSVRFTSREIIKESLTGRIVNTEVLPFTIRELNSCSQFDLLNKILKVKREKDFEFLFSERKIQNPKVFGEYLETGGLPGIAFFRETVIRNQKFEAQIDTLLNRDIRLVIKTTLPFTSLRALLKFIAMRQGQGIELKEAGEYAQISTVTLKKILYAFEALFLIRPVTSMGPEKKTGYFLEDQGMASWIAGPTQSKTYDILRGIYANLRQQLFYDLDTFGSIHSYRTKNGVNVPLVFQFRHQTKDNTVGIIPCSDRSPPPKTLGSALAFLKKNPKAFTVIAVDHDKPTFKSERLFYIPYYWLV